MPWVHRSLLLCFCLLIFTAENSSAGYEEANRQLQAFLAQNHYGAVMSRLGHDNTQRFDARINGKTVRFIIDTGCSRTVISHQCAGHLGLAIHKSDKMANGVGGMIEGGVGFARISSFTINGWEINHVNPIAVLPSTANWAEPNADGLFGFDSLILNSALLAVGGQGFLIRPGPGKSDSVVRYMEELGFLPIALHYVKGRLLVPGMISGVPFIAQIDTGAAVSGFQTSFLLKHYIEVHPIHLLMNPIDGKMTISQWFRPGLMMLGQFVFLSQPVFAIPGDGLEKFHVDALIGYDFLSLHAAIIDARDGALWLYRK
jgi:hypothetical protein